MLLIEDSNEKAVKAWGSKASEIPEGALSDGFNIAVYPKEIIGRTGSELYTLADIPAIPGTTGISASKTGDIITARTSIFRQAHVSNFFVWPSNENPEHDEIIEYITPTQIRIIASDKSTGNRKITSGCYIRGKNNIFGFHKQYKRWLRQFWKRIFWSRIAMSEFTESIIISRDVPSNAKGGYADLDDFSGVIFNSNGIFRIDFEVDPSISYKINSPVPDVPIAPKPQTSSSVHSYRYWYSAARFSGTNILRTRLDVIRIESETGSNEEDVETFEAGADHLWTDNPISTTNPNVVGPIWMPKVDNTEPQEYQWHYTHYPIYRTLDTQGRLSDPFYQEYNHPERGVWVHDLRTCGAFYAYKTRGLIIADIGLFELADVGSIIEDEEGNRDEIIEYISPRVVRYVLVGEYDYLEDSPLMAYAIGNGRVMRASQTGNLVTRRNGDVFTSVDERKTLHWASGYRTYIVEVINENTVRVHDDLDKEVQGITLDPTYRMFNDTITDTQLRSRLTRAPLLLGHRFWRPLPNCNMGVVTNGFMVVAIRNQNTYYYSQMPNNLEYTVGYHEPQIQLSRTIKDDIQLLWVFPNQISVWTSNKTYKITTNQGDFVTVPLTGEAIAALPGAQTIDPDKGCFDWGSMQDVGNGEVMLLTSEPNLVGVRRFNGESYGPNRAFNDALGQGRLSKLINEIQHATASIYNGHDGYIIWGYQDEL
jgi:hypothetical protein